MSNTFVNENTLVGEIVNKYPESADVLLGIGMHCLGCPASQAAVFTDTRFNLLLMLSTQRLRHQEDNTKKDLR